jgi:hypothetical protein
MRARWISFGVGVWLLLAPLVLGYASVTAVLHDVALGLLVCVGTLAALEFPVARLAVALPGLWLVATGSLRVFEAALVSTNELVTGIAILALSLVPSARLASSRSPAKMAA